MRKVGSGRGSTTTPIPGTLVAVRNYGSGRMTSHCPPVGGARRIEGPVAEPGAEEQATFSYRTNVGGYLEARIMPHDAFLRTTAR